MFKCIDIVGFCKTSTIHGIIEKIKNYETDKLEYILSITNDNIDNDDMYYFKDNNEEVSKFFDILKINGSFLETNKIHNFTLFGKKLHQIINDTDLFEIQIYEGNPLNQFDKLIIEPTSFSLNDIFNKYKICFDISLLN